MSELNLDKKCSQSAFGRIIGISQQAVAAHIAAGRMEPKGTLGEWLHAYTGHLRLNASGHQLTGSRAEMDKAKTRQAIAVARKDELYIAREEGLVCETEQVRACMTEWINTARDEFTNSVEKILATIESQTGAEIDREPIKRIVNAAVRVIGDYRL